MIHELAIISEQANIAENVTIGPYSVIGPDVEIGEGSWIGPHVVISGPTKIGRENKIYQFASVGEDPQDKKFDEETTYLEMGDSNVIREFVTINRGTAQGGHYTRIGNDNHFLAYSHVAHDCRIGNHNVFSNNVHLAGHVIVEDSVVIGGFTGVHQHCHIGAYAFIAKAMVVQDVLPFVLVTGHDPSVGGLNIIGLRRNGFANETIHALKKAYKTIFRKGLTKSDILAHLQEMLPDCPEVHLLIDALNQAERGYIR